MMDLESSSRNGQYIIRFIGGGPWDGHEIQKDFTPQAFCFHKTVNGELVTREYIHAGHTGDIHFYELDLPKGEADEDR